MAPLRGTTTPRGLIFHPKMFLMSCGVLNVKVYIYVARSLLDYHGNWGSMLEVSGRQRDLDEPCECGGRDGEREREWQRKWKQMERKVRNKSSEIFCFLTEKFLSFLSPLVWKKRENCPPLNILQFFTPSLPVVVRPHSTRRFYSTGPPERKCQK